MIEYMNTPEYLLSRARHYFDWAEQCMLSNQLQQAYQYQLAGSQLIEYLEYYLGH